MIAHPNIWTTNGRHSKNAMTMEKKVKDSYDGIYIYRPNNNGDSKVVLSPTKRSSKYLNSGTRSYVLKSITTYTAFALINYMLINKLLGIAKR